MLFWYCSSAWRFCDQPVRVDKDYVASSAAVAAGPPPTDQASVGPLNRSDRSLTWPPAAVRVMVGKRFGLGYANIVRSASPHSRRASLLAPDAPGSHDRRGDSEECHAQAIPAATPDRRLPMIQMSVAARCADPTRFLRTAAGASSSG